MRRAPQRTSELSGMWTKPSGRGGPASSLSSAEAWDGALVGAAEPRGAAEVMAIADEGVAEGGGVAVEARGGVGVAGSVLAQERATAMAAAARGHEVLARMKRRLRWPSPERRRPPRRGSSSNTALP